MKKYRIMIGILLAGSILLTGGCAKTEQTIVDLSSTAALENEIESLEEVTQEETQNPESEEMTQTDTALAESAEEKEEQEETPESEESTQTQQEETARPEAVKVKGIYVSGPVAGTEKLDDLIELIDSTELNAMVIDIKNDEGRVTYKMDSEQVSAIGAGIRYIPDIEELVRKCKEKNIYLIARIVAFKDPFLAENRPDLAVKTKAGGIFYDKSGLAWVNPYQKEVWDYLLEIAAEAAEVGFDEIQFDYIRFSTDLKSEQLDFGEEAADKSKTEVISEFTQYAYEKLVPLGVYVSADVYGTIIDSAVDQAIVGQDYREMAQHLDYICPMVYPSHYANGVYGIAIPDAQPYETVYAAMSAAAEQLADIPEQQRAVNRVWIQCFTATWVDGHISYGAKEIRDQIHGAFDAGYEEWILWNAAVRYNADDLMTDDEALELEQQWKVEKTELP